MPDHITLSNVTEYPRHIACLTEETTETIYLSVNRTVLPASRAIPPGLRKRAGNRRFLHSPTAKFEKIMAVEPDLVLAFSDLQADIVREFLIRGVPVLRLQPTKRGRRSST